MADPFQYMAGECAAESVLASIAADTAPPNELEVAASLLMSESARAGFFRTIQKQLEQACRESS